MKKKILNSNLITINNDRAIIEQNTKLCDGDINSIREKYRNILFLNNDNYNDNMLLLQSLETIEVMSNTLSEIDKNSFLLNNIIVKSFILLNWQILGSAQEQLSREFTKDKKILNDISFANISKGKSRIWFSRREIAHILSFDIIESQLDMNTISVMIRDCDKLREEIIKIFERSKQIKNSDLTILKSTQKLNLKLDLEEQLNYSDNKEWNNINGEYIYLQNIHNSIKFLQKILSKIDEEQIILESVSLQSLILFAEQIVGNNIKKLDNKFAELLQDYQYIYRRNNIAHSKLFSDNITSDFEFLKSRLKHLYRLAETIEKKYIHVISSNIIASNYYIETEEQCNNESDYEQEDICVKQDKKLKKKKSKETDDEILEKTIADNNDGEDYNQFSEERKHEKLIAMFKYFKSTLKQDFDHKEFVIDDKIFTGKFYREALLLTIKTLLDSGIDVNKRFYIDIKKGKFSTNFVAMSVDFGNFELCKLIFQYNPDFDFSTIDIHNKNSDRIMNYISLCSDELFELILKNGGNADYNKSGDVTLLFTCIKDNLEKKIKLLLEYGAGFEDRCKMRLENKISFSALEFAVVINKKTSFNIIAKHIVNRFGYRKLNDVLKSKNKYNKFLDYNSTILTLCRDLSYPDSINFSQLIINLIEVSSDTEFPNKDLYRAIISEDIELIIDYFKDKSPKEIIDIWSFKIPLENKNIEGYTILDLAKAIDCDNIAKKILEIRMNAQKELSNTDKVKMQEEKAKSTNQTR